MQGVFFRGIRRNELRYYKQALILDGTNLYFPPNPKIVRISVNAATS